jgi:hypothetical protein
MSTYFVSPEKVIFAEVNVLFDRFENAGCSVRDSHYYQT